MPISCTYSMQCDRSGMQCFKTLYPTPCRLSTLARLQLAPAALQIIQIMIET